MPGWAIAITLIALVAARQAGQRWFVRRWLDDGMSPTRAALLSIAVTQLPIVAMFVALALFGDMSPGSVALLTGLLLLPSIFWFGLRRAVFDYMDNHGVKDDLRRHDR